jgi:hypothetical protein
LIIATSRNLLNRFLNACIYGSAHLDLQRTNIRQNLDNIINVLHYLRAASVLKFQEGSMRVDGVRRELVSAFLDNYLPVTTTPNGDCFYNAISLCLFGNEQYSQPIRLGTMCMLHKYRDQFLIRGHEVRYDVDDCLCGSGIPHNLVDLGISTYGRQLVNEYHWANSLSIAGTSVAIGRPIYIYYSLRDSSGRSFRYRNDLTAAEFDNQYNEGVLVMGSDCLNRRQPVTVLLYNRHFSALLPACDNPLPFVPGNPSEIRPIVVQNGDSSLRDDAI